MFQLGEYLRGTSPPSMYNHTEHSHRQLLLKRCIGTHHDVCYGIDNNYFIIIIIDYNNVSIVLRSQTTPTYCFQRAAGGSGTLPCM